MEESSYYELECRRAHLESELKALKAERDELEWFGSSKEIDENDNAIMEVSNEIDEITDELERRDAKEEMETDLLDSHFP